MRTQIQVLLTSFILLALPATASANFAHIVARGESLTSVAAADGLSVAQLAAANGLSPGTDLVAGSTLEIPPQSEAVASPAESAAPAGDDAQPALAQPQAAAGSYVVRPGDTLSAIAAANGLSVDQLAAANGLDPSAPLLAGSTVSIGGASQAAPAAGASQGAPSAGSYVVHPGDTLSAIAAASGLSVDQLAADNGLDPNGVLLAGSTLNVGGGSAASTVQPETTGVAGTGAQPTPETVSPQDIGQIAGANGVPPSLAEAIGYQESGFNNDLVSSTGATGVMQIEPATWSYIGRELAPPPPLSPYSAQDNVLGGVLLLHSLLDQTGGDPSLAAAGYYQGLSSVAQHGMLPSTQRYVADVMALQHQFGGP